MHDPSDPDFRRKCQTRPCPARFRGTEAWQAAPSVAAGCRRCGSRGDCRLGLRARQSFHTADRASESSQIRRTAADRFRSTIGDSKVYDYIESLGRQLAADVPNGDFDWELAVIREDVGGSTHEALSVPGGHIFVSASLILAVDSEAELAGMLAHSMAHIAERHETRMATRGQVINLSIMPLVFIGGRMGMGSAGSDDRALLPMGYLKMQRSNELDADRVAVNIMAAAGYDPAALLGYIRRTQRATTAESTMYSALPPRDERITALETAISDVPSRTARSSGEFEAIQGRVRELAVPSRAESPSPLKQPPSLR